MASPDHAPAPSGGFEHDHEQARVRLHGHLRFQDAGRFWRDLRSLGGAVPRGASLDFDMSAVQHIDGGVMALLSEVRDELRLRGVRSRFVNVAPTVTKLVQLYDAGDAPEAPAARPPRRGLLDRIGRASLRSAEAAQRALGFLGGLLVSVPSRSPRVGSLGSTRLLIERSGTDAVPIVALTNFLVGLVMAMQSAVQLRNFGATLYVADLVWISMTRELGPLMTAIVLSGRSGAAFTAELGTMAVSSEIDALRTMGFEPMRYLVVPRVIALMVVMPVLCLLADVVGIVGGMVVAVTSLDLTWSVYVSELQRSVKPWDVGSGLIKSVLFGFAIAMVACGQGLSATDGAEGVGRRTTAAVVSSLVLIIVIDATYTAIFQVLNV